MENYFATGCREAAGLFFHFLSVRSSTFCRHGNGTASGQTRELPVSEAEASRLQDIIRRDRLLFCLNTVQQEDRRRGGHLCAVGDVAALSSCRGRSLLFLGAFEIEPVLSAARVLCLG